MIAVMFEVQPSADGLPGSTNVAINAPMGGK